VKIVIDHLGKPDLTAPDPWADFRKMFRLKRFAQVWVSASEPYELSLTKQFPYTDTYPFSNRSVICRAGCEKIGNER
jgi:predicted TIM-barrel fold metal-dependent hydrolase